MNIAAALKNCRMFSELTEDELRRFADMARHERARARTLLFSEGDICDRFYVVASGRVKVFRVNEQGREQILHVVNPGESFAEAAMFSGSSFPASAEALSASDLITIPAGPFIACLRKDPELTLKFLAGITRWLRLMVDLVGDLSLKDVQARLVGYLLNEAKTRKIALKPGARIPLGMTKTQLAQRLGTVSEVLSRTLYKLQKDGAIKVGLREVEVLDPRLLRG